MLYLIVSDVHGNWEAFESVLRQVRGKRFDATLVLGDLVGYGASPARVLDQLSELPGERVFVVRGNHDKLVAGLEDGADFNDIARTAAYWSREQLGREHLGLLRDLPRGPRVVEGATLDEARRAGESDLGALARPSVAICHGSPADEDEYLFSERDAWQSFCTPPQASVMFFGHTHLPSLFVFDGDQAQGVLLRGQRGRIELKRFARYLINPGSIGQPRDRNWRASYMIYDSDRRLLRWRRVRYPIARAQERIRAAGLPEPLADRLELGI